MLFAVYDTETTGLPDHPDAPIEQQPRIIEFGGIITDGVSVIDTLEFICDPGIAIEDIITEITGLKNEDLKGKPDIGEYVSKLGGFFVQADASIAHNANFDKSMLYFDLTRRDLTLESIHFPKIEICTVEQTYHQYGKRVKLIDLYRELVGEYEQKHRGMDDVLRLHEICKKIGIYNAFQ